MQDILYQASCMSNLKTDLTEKILFRVQKSWAQAGTEPVKTDDGHYYLPLGWLKSGSMKIFLTETLSDILLWSTMISQSVCFAFCYKESFTGFLKPLRLKCCSKCSWRQITFDLLLMLYLTSPILFWSGQGLPSTLFRISPSYPCDDLLFLLIQFVLV